MRAKPLWILGLVGKRASILACVPLVFLAFAVALGAQEHLVPSDELPDLGYYEAPCSTGTVPCPNTCTVDPNSCKTAPGGHVKTCVMICKNRKK